VNLRSFRRGLKDPELPEGWERTVKLSERTEGGSIEEMLRGLFEKVLQEALKEIDRQAAEETHGKPIKAWGLLNGKSGQSFRLTIDCEPPSVDPNLN
jgi:hypothetical protein